MALGRSVGSRDLSEAKRKNGSAGGRIKCFNHVSHEPSPQWDRRTRSSLLTRLAILLGYSTSLQLA